MQNSKSKNSHHYTQKIRVENERGQKVMNTYVQSAANNTNVAINSTNINNENIVENDDDNNYYNIKN